MTGSVLPGLVAACRVLARGGAVVVANPAPMAYGVVATRAETVNRYKGRPLDQNVAVSVHDDSQWSRVVPCLDLSPEAVAAAVAMLHQRLSLLLPLRAGVERPRWVEPAIRDGWLAAFNGYWDLTAPLWEAYPQLYGSSANRTGQPPVTSAAQAIATFGPACVVVGDDGIPASSGPRSASTMVRIDRDGHLALHRSGAQDAASGQQPQAFLRSLAVDVGLAGPRDLPPPTATE